MEQTTGRDRLNLHGTINLETRRTQILDVERVDGPSLLKLLEQVESAHPQMRRIHVFLDNATHHRAVIVKGVAGKAERKRAALPANLLPPSRSHRTTVGLMHQNITHNLDFKTFHEFRIAVIDFLRDEGPSTGAASGDRITDKFRVIRRQGFRVIVEPKYSTVFFSYTRPPNPGCFL